MTTATPTPQSTPDLTAAGLADRFKGDAHKRMRQARETADHLEAVLECIDAGEITATATEIARLEGADLALRLITKPQPAGRRRGSRNE
ncbi:hypothetical protein ACIPI2_12650 [Micrococcus luteus]|uniref:hypothetical protein n=1 Tax=Micrococcus luteus TaxID=1270 RepID=UPI00381B619D